MDQDALRTIVEEVLEKKLREIIETVAREVIEAQCKTLMDSLKSSLLVPSTNVTADLIEFADTAPNVIDTITPVRATSSATDTIVRPANPSLDDTMSSRMKARRQDALKRSNVISPKDEVLPASRKPTEPPISPPNKAVDATKKVEPDHLVFPSGKATSTVFLQIPSPRIENISSQGILVSSHDESAKTYSLILISPARSVHRILVNTRPVAVRKFSGIYACLYPTATGGVNIVKYSNSLMETRRMTISHPHSISHNGGAMYHGHSMFRLHLDRDDKFASPKKSWMVGTMLCDTEGIVYVATTHMLCRYEANSINKTWAHVAPTSYPIEALYACGDWCVYTSGYMLNLLDKGGQCHTITLKIIPAQVVIDSDAIYFLGDDAGLHKVELKGGSLVSSNVREKMEDITGPMYIEDNVLYYTTKTSINKLSLV